MNDTDTMCERCGEEPATVLVEHVLYGEAICHGCRVDEDDAVKEITDGED